MISKREIARSLQNSFFFTKKLEREAREQKTLHTLTHEAQSVRQPHRLVGGLSLEDYWLPMNQRRKYELFCSLGCVVGLSTLFDFLPAD